VKAHIYLNDKMFEVNIDPDTFMPRKTHYTEEEKAAIRNLYRERLPPDLLGTAKKKYPVKPTEMK
jgi:hypothetical protein